MAVSPTSSPARMMVFIPMYNCEKQIPRVIAQFTPEVQQWFEEVVVVNNRSTDDSVRAAETAMKKHLNITRGTILTNDTNVNLGGSHKVAFNYAREKGYTHIAVLHGDDQGRIADLIPHLHAGDHVHHECLLGARFMKGSSLPGYSLPRIAGNLAFNLLFSAAAMRMLYDLGSGLNLFATRAMEKMPYMRFANRLTFNYYLILGLVHYKIDFKFFPIVWREDDQVSNAKLMNHGMNMLKLLWRYVTGPSRFFAEDYTEPGTVYTAQTVFSTAGKAKKASNS